MRILLCSPTPLTTTLGASRVYIEAAEGFRRAGWESTVVGPDDVAGGAPGDVFTQPPLLRNYLRQHASEFDVVEYEHHQLPFPRSDFPGEPLFVARSVLLCHFFESIRIPPRSRLKSRIGSIVKRWPEKRRIRRTIQQANLTLAGADLVNLCTVKERDMLVAHGHPADKMLIFPHGMFPERLAAFMSDPSVLPDRPVVGFVGTFDPRKGMCEFPALVEQVATRIPQVKFRLLGTAGMVQDAAGVRGHFPRRLWPRLEISPRFDPADLPRLLEGVSVGVFPTRVEGFGYGVLEMLAAAVPVVAYDAPGPDSMLAGEFLVRVGDHAQMAEKVAALLDSPVRLRAAREWARSRAGDFHWEEIAARTADAYARLVARFRRNVQAAFQQELT
jgi:glycosyltransferase involved in cell wall biosynthesis